jgi:hypothetical protein
MTITAVLARLHRARVLRSLLVAALGLRVALGPAPAGGEAAAPALLYLVVVAAVIGMRLRASGGHQTRRELWTDAVITAASAGTLAVFGSWTAAVIVALSCALESHRIPFPASGVSPAVRGVFSLAVSALLLPLAGAALSGGLNASALNLLLLTVPLALADLPHIAGGGTGARHPASSALPALAGLTLAVAVVVRGAGLSLALDRMLLAAAPGALFAVIGWLSLLDPQPERRADRLVLITGCGAVALSAMVLLVL